MDTLDWKKNAIDEFAMVLLIHAVNQGKKYQIFLTFAVTSKVSRWAAQSELLYAQPFKKIWCLLLPTERQNVWSYITFYIIAKLLLIFWDTQL